MDGTRAIAIALLLCLAPLGGISTGAAQDQDAGMSVVTPGDTAEYLAPADGAIDRTGQRGASFDLGGTVGANAGAVRTTYYRVSLQRAYENAESDEQRREVVRNGTDRLVDRIDELDRTERRGVEQYSAGERSETGLFRLLVMVRGQAEETESSIDWLETRADNLGMDAVEPRLALQRTRVRTFQGPVRDDLDEALGSGSDRRVHVDASSGGLVLAKVSESNGDVSYVREANDPSARTTDFEERTQPGLSAAEERLRDLYPWVTNNSTPTATPIGPDYARLWRFTYSHPHGNLETYLDVETDRVFLERQTKNPEAVPTTTVNETDDDLRLQLEVTRAGGPLGLSVYDATSDEPVDADLELGDDDLGATGGDRRWTVAPRGETTINATHAGRTLTYETTFE